MDIKPIAKLPCLKHKLRQAGIRGRMDDLRVEDAKIENTDPP